MAPPTRLRPHLNDLLQKNLELEHAVADLRHQLTQSSAKWADERKTLAVGCDALMASFAKFRAQLDVQPSDLGDSEGEVEQNLDAAGQGEETGEMDGGMLEAETDKDRGSLATDDLHGRCRVLTAELRVKGEELEESRRKREAAEEEIQRIQQSLDTQSEQLRAALASSKTDALAGNTVSRVSPEPTPDDPLAQVNSSITPPDNSHEKLDQANQEIARLKQLLQEWKKYGNDWKRDGQQARVRASELHRREEDLNTKIKAAEETNARQDMEIQRLANALADQTVAAEQQRTACQESERRVHDLETMVACLRAQLSPEQLACFDNEQNQAASEPPGSTLLQTASGTARVSSDPTLRVPGPDGVSPTPPPVQDMSINKRGEMIMLKIPYRSFVRKPSSENNESQIEQQNATTPLEQAPANQCVRVSPAPEGGNNPPEFNAADFEICIHTCNALLCRNDSRSFLWPRKQPSLPRHVLSTRKHQLCSPVCPGYRLLTMPLADATKESRKSKCRPPTDAELALAIEESRRIPPRRRKSEKGAEADGLAESEGSGEPEEQDELEGSSRAEDAQEMEEADAIRLGKRTRTQTTEEERSRKLRPRISAIAKP